MMSLKMIAQRAILKKWRKNPPSSEQVEYIKMLFDRSLVSESFVRVLREKVCRLHDEWGDLSRRCCPPYLHALAAMAYFDMMGPETDFGIGCGFDSCRDISTIPKPHMAKLINHMTDHVYLERLRGDLNIIFANLRCKSLYLKDIHLSRSTSMSLLRIMQWGNLVELELINCSFAHLANLTAYNGKGTCKTIIVEMSNTHFVQKMDQWQCSVGWVCVIARLKGSTHQYPHYLNAAMYKRCLG